MLLVISYSAYEMKMYHNTDTLVPEVFLNYLSGVVRERAPSPRGSEWASSEKTSSHER